jgi:plasmid stabilization system protein ParE
MAVIEWKDSAWQLYNDMLEYAKVEFGAKTGRQWEYELQCIYERLQHFPDSYPPEEFLLGRTPLYRRCSMMNRRFKLIYYYDEPGDTVHIIDIWDSRMKPETLIRRIK